MFGKNKILAPINNNGDFLEVTETFKTLQGEGPFVGMPAIFIRLGGCNLQCNFCDTEFDNFKKIHIDEILLKINSLAFNEDNIKTHKLVVITGGEPLRQPIEKFCELLIANNYLVQIETNGTLYRRLPSQVKIICSPKVVNNKYHRIREDLLKIISCFKFIISFNNSDYSNVPEIGQSDYNIEVFVQPMDEYDQLKNFENTKRAIFLCDKYGFRLSLQTHKILSLP
jgi:7-carboxy-7-deazaguanine synthase